MKTTDKTTEDNRLIAEFMNKINDGNNKYIYDTTENAKYRFNSSWDWLMPVVDKIERTHDKHHGYFAVYIGSNGCTIQGTNLRTDKIQDPPIYFSDVYGSTKLEATHEAVIKFIKWYNNENRNLQ